MLARESVEPLDTKVDTLQFVYTHTPHTQKQVDTLQFVYTHTLPAQGSKQVILVKLLLSPQLHHISQADAVTRGFVAYRPLRKPTSAV